MLFSRYKALLATGADINATEDVFKRTPLHWASGSKRIDIDIIKSLLEKGADINAIDACGETPLHFAIRYGNESVVNALLAQEGINVNIADIDGMTPLHQAVFYNYTNIVNALLKKEAYPSWQDESGKTPLHLAVEYGYKDVMKTLLLAGANTSLENNDGDTPIDSTISDEIKKLFKDTENELHNMKNKKIGDTNVSFYEFLQASNDRLKIYVRNVNLCTELKKCQYEIDNPIYASMIGDRFRMGIKIKHLEKNASIALENYVPTFNEDVCELITSYLTEVDDLDSVIKSTIKNKTGDYVYK